VSDWTHWQYWRRFSELDDKVGGQCGAGGSRCLTGLTGSTGYVSLSWMTRWVVSVGLVEVDV